MLDLGLQLMLEIPSGTVPTTLSLFGFSPPLIILVIRSRGRLLTRRSNTIIVVLAGPREDLPLLARNPIFHECSGSSCFRKRLALIFIFLFLLSLPVVPAKMALCSVGERKKRKGAKRC